MNDNNFLPDDLEQCQQLLLAAYKQSVRLEGQAAKAEQRVAEMGRVLDETSASYQELQNEHFISSKFWEAIDIDGGLVDGSIIDEDTWKECRLRVDFN